MDYWANRMELQDRNRRQTSPFDSRVPRNITFKFVATQAWPGIKLMAPQLLILCFQSSGVPGIRSLLGRLHATVIPAIGEVNDQADDQPYD